RPGGLPAGSAGGGPRSSSSPGSPRRCSGAWAGPGSCSPRPWSKRSTPTGGAASPPPSRATPLAGGTGAGGRDRPPPAPCGGPPLYWLARARIDAEAELACDAWVVWALPGDRLAYAEALFDIGSRASRALAPAPALGVVGPGRFLERRLTMILREQVPCRVSP